MSANTFTVMSLQRILCQALEMLGYHWFKFGTLLTRKGLYLVRSTPGPPPAMEPMFIIYGKALSRRCEANDSALIRALIFIDQTLGYKIGDVNYVQ